MKQSVQSSEWVLVGSLLLIMASLVVISKVNVYRAASTLALNEIEVKEILVTVKGAVAKPGAYRVLEGTLLETVLRKARPWPHANLKALPLKRPLEGESEIVVEELAEITVYVDGAVEKRVELTLPAKSRVSDLKSKVVLSEDADKSYFRRRRWLKDGEKIEVPKKTVEENSALCL
ncbi:MAG TPA: SLBB domain-containing protein [Chlamydiales bacterium]|nr:SLBB domain-containing protein [Chlamydiales bacterium]